jgi:hypothetical protein
MLRLALLVFALVLTGAGLLGQLAGGLQNWPLTLWGLLLLVAVLCERWRYKRCTDSPVDSIHAQWQKTAEQFIDPETGQAMQVWYCAQTGERRYTGVKGHADAG